MGIISKIRTWLALRKARNEEEKHLPGRDELEKEEQEFLKETEELKKLVTKQKVYKSNAKSGKHGNKTGKHRKPEQGKLRSNRR